MAIAEKLFPGADPFILNHGGKDFDASRFFRLPFDPDSIPSIYEWRNPKKKL